MKRRITPALVERFQRFLEDLERSGSPRRPRTKPAVLLRAELDGLRYVLSRAPTELASRVSPRQREIAALLQRGLTAKAIAAKLSLSPPTVVKHLVRLHAKLGVHKRGELVRVLTLLGEG